MFKGLVPREEKFFDQFKMIGELLVKGAKEFKEMVSDLNHAEVHAAKIREIETSGDDVTHKTVELLHRTFITPFDREDIHQLASRMDDIIDYIEAASERVFLYEIKKSTPELVALADICVKSVEGVNKVMHHLENLKDSREILKHCVEVNRLENEADRALRSAMAKLFKEEPDIRELLKMKELYMLLETVTDCCEDVVNTVEGIVLENA